MGDVLKIKNISDKYSDKRSPSWTDRILYKFVYTGDLNFKEYNSLNDITLSDHK